MREREAERPTREVLRCQAKTEAGVCARVRLWCVGPCMHLCTYIQPQCGWDRGVGGEKADIFAQQLPCLGEERCLREQLLIAQGAGLH